MALKYDKAEYLNTFKLLMRVHSYKWGPYHESIIDMANLQPNESKLSYMPLELSKSSKAKVCIYKTIIIQPLTKLDLFLSTDDDLQKG